MGWRALVVLSVSSLFPETGIAQDFIDAAAGDRVADTVSDYLHHDFCAAITIRPASIARSDFGKSIPFDDLMKSLFTHETVDTATALKYASFEKIESITVLVDPFPGGNVAFFPGVVIEFTEQTPGLELVQSLFPAARPYLADKKLIVDLESMAGASVQAYLAGSKTLVIAPEPTMKKMRSQFRSPRNPLKMQVSSDSFRGDFAIAYVSQPALDRMVALFGLSEAELRADPDTDESVKVALLDMSAAACSLRLGTAPKLHLSVRCKTQENAAAIEQLVNLGINILMTARDNQELKKELPPDVREIVSAPALQDFAKSLKVARKRNTVELDSQIPGTAIELARRSSREFIAELSRVAAASAAGGSMMSSWGEEFVWKRKQPAIEMIHKDDGLVFLMGVQGALRMGAAISLSPNSEGIWRLYGTDHADLEGRAVAMPWFDEFEKELTFKIWRKGEPDFPKLIHQRNGFCVPVKIAGAFNGQGEVFRLHVDETGFWRLRARSQAAGTCVSLRILRSTTPGSFTHEIEEHSWRNGNQRKRLIHKDDGFVFLSGLAGSFRGGGEYARVRLDQDGYWYLEGRSNQGFMTARAITVRYSRSERGSN